MDKSGKLLFPENNIQRIPAQQAGKIKRDDSPKGHSDHGKQESEPEMISISCRKLKGLSGYDGYDDLENLSSPER
jgi:hypothetical protein